MAEVRDAALGSLFEPVHSLLEPVESLVSLERILSDLLEHIDERVDLLSHISLSNGHFAETLNNSLLSFFESLLSLVLRHSQFFNAE